MDLEDIKQILSLVREHDLSEFELEREGLKLRVRKASAAVPMQAMPMPMPVASPMPAPVAAPPPQAGPANAAPEETVGGVELAVIKSPIVGTFYRTPEPGARAFVEVGDTVKKGQVLCIIEAMKLMNEIESDCDGEITAIYVENGKPVQFGDRLFAVRVR
ncbi:MAG TPA: acetyl-CoA carboxylase biotin carboxyl carrier protein [Vicinamibacterales bacterium]|nr:acetyl-CoA carboxylase biotin carboxyl carrier protein [Vicinamibacterales bacterium]